MRNTLKFIFLFCVLTCFSFRAAAQNTSAQENKKAKLEKEIAMIDRQLSSVSKKTDDALGQYNLIKKKVEARKSLVVESQKTIEDYNQKIRKAQKEIDKMQERVDTLTVYYGRLIKSAYKSRDAKSWYLYFLASDNVGQALRRYNYFKSLSGNLSAQAAKIKEAQAELEAQKKELSALKKEAEVLKVQRQKDLDIINSEEKQAGNLLAKLRKEKKKYTDEIARKRREVDALDREIRRLIGKASGKSGSAAVDYKLAGEFEKNKGKLPWPADGVVVESYGQHYHPVFTTVKLPFNKGIEIAVSPDSEVRTVFDGVVSHVIMLPSYNICVLVQHGSYFSFYCKLKKADVKVGEKVKTNQKIGTADTIRGESRVHFEIWEGQQHQDPESWLRP